MASRSRGEEVAPAAAEAGFGGVKIIIVSDGIDRGDN
jgi:hypothetical protein